MPEIDIFVHTETQDRLMENQNLDQQFNQNQQVPNATAVLVLGIISIVICWLYRPVRAGMRHHCPGAGGQGQKGLYGEPGHVFGRFLRQSEGGPRLCHHRDHTFRIVCIAGDHRIRNRGHPYPRQLERDHGFRQRLLNVHIPL